MKALADVITPEISSLFNRNYNRRNIEYIKPPFMVEHQQYTDICIAKDSKIMFSSQEPMVKNNPVYFVNIPLTTEQQYWNTHIVPKIDYFYELELALKLLLYVQCELQYDTIVIPLKNVNNFMDNTYRIYVSGSDLRILCKIFNVVFTENYCDTVRALVNVLVNAQILDKTVYRKIYELYTACEEDINLNEYISLDADELFITYCYHKKIFS